MASCSSFRVSCRGTRLARIQYQRVGLSVLGRVRHPARRRSSCGPGLKAFGVFTAAVGPFKAEQIAFMLGALATIFLRAPSHHRDELHEVRPVRRIPVGGGRRLRRIHSDEGSRARHARHGRLQVVRWRRRLPRPRLQPSRSSRTIVDEGPAGPSLASGFPGRNRGPTLSGRDENAPGSNRRRGRGLRTATGVGTPSVVGLAPTGAELPTFCLCHEGGAYQ